MKSRLHHHNKGLRQIRRGKTAVQLREICRRLGLPIVTDATKEGRDGDRLYRSD